MRWKLLGAALLLGALSQCGGDMTNNGKANVEGRPASAYVYEFRTPEELRDFRFPSDALGAVGFRLTRIEKETQEFRAVPFFNEDGQHSLDDDFVNTELIRIIVFR
ncbi:MAG: hypothetical protein OXT69_02535 [Candidatus Poribacteria bacterium]|nr:hypothetical protein [Candidatus Poribacteria bacterium]